MQNTGNQSNLNQAPNPFQEPEGRASKTASVSEVTAMDIMQMQTVTDNNEVLMTNVTGNNAFDGSVSTHSKRQSLNS